MGTKSYYGYPFRYIRYSTYHMPFICSSSRDVSLNSTLYSDDLNKLEGMLRLQRFRRRK